MCGKRKKFTVYDEEDEGEKKCAARCCDKLKSNLHLLLLFLAIIVGVSIGYMLRFIPPFDDPKTHPREMMYLFLPAELMIRIMQLLTIPLLMSSLISSLGSLDPGLVGRIGGRMFAYYIGTTILAVTEGFGFSVGIRMATDYFLERTENETLGNFTAVESNVTSPVPADLETIDVFIDMFRNMIPDNLVGATFELTQTERGIKNITVDGQTIQIESLSLIPTRGINILGLAVFSLALGISISAAKEKGRALQKFADSVFECIMIILRLMLWLFPVGVVFMMIRTTVELVDPLAYLLKMAVFLSSVVFGMITHMFIILPLLYWLLTWRNPFKHMARCFNAIMLAFATNNSNITMPMTFECLEKAGISKSLIRFMIPIGATINMDGFALYEAMALTFIASINGMIPSAGALFTAGLTAVIISIGAPTAGGGIVLFVILFNSMGLPIEDIPLLIPFDWLMTKFRTSCNVWGDCVGAGIINHTCREALEAADTPSSYHLGGDEDSDEGHYICEDEEESRGHEDNIHPFTPSSKTEYARNDFTVKLTNENGDNLFVSKV